MTGGIFIYFIWQNNKLHFCQKKITDSGFADLSQINNFHKNNRNTANCRRLKVKHNKNHLPGTKLRQL